MNEQKTNGTERNILPLALIAPQRQHKRHITPTDPTCMLSVVAESFCVSVYHALDDVIHSESSPLSRLPLRRTKENLAANSTHRHRQHTTSSANAVKHNTWHSSEYTECNTSQPCRVQLRECAVSSYPVIASVSGRSTQHTHALNQTLPDIQSSSQIFLMPEHVCCTPQYLAVVRSANVPYILIFFLD